MQLTVADDQPCRIDAGDVGDEARRARIRGREVRGTALRAFQRPGEAQRVAVRITTRAAVERHTRAWAYGLRRAGRSHRRLVADWRRGRSRRSWRLGGRLRDAVIRLLDLELGREQRSAVPVALCLDDAAECLGKERTGRHVHILDLIARPGTRLDQDPRHAQQRCVQVRSAATQLHFVVALVAFQTHGHDAPAAGRILITRDLDPVADAQARDAELPLFALLVLETCGGRDGDRQAQRIEGSTRGIDSVDHRLEADARLPLDRHLVRDQHAARIQPPLDLDLDVQCQRARLAADEHRAGGGAHLLACHIEVARRSEARDQSLHLDFVAGAVVETMILTRNPLGAQRAVGKELTSFHLDDVARGRSGGAEVLQLGGGIVDAQAANAEPACHGVVIGHAALDLDLDVVRLRTLEARGARKTVRADEAVDFDAIAAREARHRALTDGIVERRVVVCPHALARNHDDTGRRIHGLDFTLQQASHLDGPRPPAAVVVYFRLQAHDLADLELGERCRPVLDAHGCGRRVVAHAVDDDAAEAADRARHDDGLCGTRTGRRL